MSGFRPDSPQAIMPNRPLSRLFTSESVTEGHPDKLADQISDAIVDAILARNREKGRAACETLLTNGLVVVAGEVRAAAGNRAEPGAASIDVERIVRDTLLNAGYDRPEYGIDGVGCGVLVALHEQAAEITHAVDGVAANDRGPAGDDGGSRASGRTGAGDQGMMFGYACDDIPGAFMPAPIAAAHALVRRLAEARKRGEIPWLRPDGKSQVTFEYDNEWRPHRIRTIVLSAQHDEDADPQAIPGELGARVIRPVLARPEFARFDDGQVELRINTSGSFVQGGPHADAGLTGRKIIVDTYGGMGRHGGGAFSGKDPTKVDRSGAYAARWAAKNIVAARLARRCEVQLAYAIGQAEPVQLWVDTFGTATNGLSDRAINHAAGEIFDFTPDAIRGALGLNAPIYGPTAVYGHFGRSPRMAERHGRVLRLFGWERTNRVDRLRQALGLK